MLGVAILAGMSLAMYSTMGRVLTANERAQRRENLTHEARIALSKMSEELSQAFAANMTLKGTNQAYQAGMKGNEDSIHFSTFGHYHFMKDHKDTDQVTVGYFVEKNENGFLRIMRRESDHLSDKLDTGGSPEPLVENVKKFHLRYYDSNKKDWVNEWDSTQISVLGRLPEMVEIEIEVVEVDPGDPREEKSSRTFFTTARVELYQNELNF